MTAENVTPIFGRKNNDGRLVLDTSNPREAAKAILAEHYQLEGDLTLLRIDKCWWKFNGVTYDHISEEQFDADLYKQLSAAFHRHQGADIPVIPKSQLANEITRAVKGLSQVKIDAEPSWINAGVGEFAGEYLAFENGILNITTGELLDHTPRFYSVNSITSEFDPNAPIPAQFFSFVEQAFDNALDQNAFIEALAYIVFGHSEYQKIILFYGLLRSGKSTTVKLLREILGPNSVAALGADLGNRFVLEHAYNAKALVIPDLMPATKSGKGAATQFLKAASGGDPMNIDRKGKTAITRILRVPIIITSNSLPEFEDTTSALANRMHGFRFLNSMLGKEDPNLLKKLSSEKSEIISLLHKRYLACKERGRLLTSPTTEFAKAECLKMFSPIESFVAERCEVGADNIITLKALHGAYLRFADDHDISGISIKAFNQSVLNSFPTLRKSQSRKVGESNERHHVWIGLRLKETFVVEELSQC